MAADADSRPDRTPSGSDPYLVAHIRETLARDPRVNELELQVTIAAGKVFISGSVPTEERRDAVTAVATELLPDHEVHNQTNVNPMEESPEVETIR